MSFVTNATAFLRDLLATRFWEWKVTAVLVAYSLVFATPTFHYMETAFDRVAWRVVMDQVNDDFIYQPTGVAADNQAAKKTFRLTVPMIARVLHLRQAGIYALQFLLGIGFIFLVVRFVHRLTNDRLMAAMFAAGFVSLFIGRACFTDIYSRFEGWCYLFIFLCIFFRQPPLVFLFAFLACWTDERAVIGLAFAGLWWLYRDGFFNGRRWLSNDFFIGPIGAIGTACVAYAALRVWLETQYGLHTPLSNVTWTYILTDIDYLNLGTWTFLEGMWLLVIYKMWLLWRQRSFWFFGLSLLFTAATVFASFMVYDVTKTGSFIFIDAFTSVAVIGALTNARQLYKVLAAAAAVSVLFPGIYIVLRTDLVVYQQDSILILAVKYFSKHFLH